MIKEILAEKEPIAYRTLQHALSEGKVAHSYLFSGEYSPLKIDAAILLAQSIIEGKGRFADEESPVSQRIRNRQYLDFLYLDGYKGLIKKETVSSLIERFSATAVEESGRKVYIVANVNNMNVNGINALLKFMEEPSGQNYGIFITDRKEDVLPTIVSRCQEVPFLQRDFSAVEEEYLHSGFEESDAHLLAEILHNYDPEFDKDNEFFQNAKDFVYQTIDLLDKKDYIPVLYYRDLYSLYSNRDDMKVCTDYYLDIMIRMLEDAIGDIRIDDEEYNGKLRKLKAHDPAKLLEIFEDARDKTLLMPERKLLFDAIAYAIISYI